MSLRKAINLKCKDCCYDSKSGLGGWLQQVNDCPCTSCPLFGVRPKINANRHDSQLVAHKSNKVEGVVL